MKPVCGRNDVAKVVIAAESPDMAFASPSMLVGRWSAQAESTAAGGAAIGAGVAWFPMRREKLCSRLSSARMWASASAEPQGAALQGRTGTPAAIVGIPGGCVCRGTGRAMLARGEHGRTFGGIASGAGGANGDGDWALGVSGKTLRGEDVSTARASCLESLASWMRDALASASRRLQRMRSRCSSVRKPGIMAATERRACEECVYTFMLD